MWQEARKHERKLRGMMVDYKRRGERRREYYEKIVRLSRLMSTLLCRYAARMNDISVMIGRKEPADGRLANDVYYATVCDMKSNLALHSSR